MTSRGVLKLGSQLDGVSKSPVSSWPRQSSALACFPSSGCNNLLLYGAGEVSCSWRGTARVTPIAGRKNASPRKYQQAKSRVTETPKKLGAVGGAPLKSSPVQIPRIKEAVSLNEDQAIGQVITAQANFMRIIVHRAGREEVLRSAEPPGESRGLAAVHKNGEGEHLSNNSLNKPEVELLCVVRNVLKKIGRRVLVGDKVVVTGIDWTEKRGMIEDVIDRRSEILDPPVANVNNLVLVFSIDQPRVDEKVLSRFLVEAESTGIPFSLVLNKVDLVQPEVVGLWQDRLRMWGYDPVLCSADLRIGLSSLTSRLRNQISVILGPSGVGKSSLINVLRDEKGFTLWNQVEEQQQSLEEGLVAAVDKAEAPVQQVFDEAFEELRVGEVSMGSGRGRHTTRHVSLLRVPGGIGRLADTPGFSQPSLTKVTSTSLSHLFPEVDKMISESENGRCAFPNCLHVGEPFCAVGEDWDRHEHYIALLEEVQNREKVEKRVLGTKRESEVRYKVGADGVKHAESRLLLKRHRRASRKQINQSLEEDFREEEKLQADIEEDTVQTDLVDSLRGL